MGFQSCPKSPGEWTVGSCNWSSQAKKKKGEGGVHAFITGQVGLEIFPFLLIGGQVHEGT